MRSRGISETKAQIIYARDRYTCVYCGRKAVDVRMCYEGKYNRPYDKIKITEIIESRDNLKIFKKITQKKVIKIYESTLK